VHCLEVAHNLDRRRISHRGGCHPRLTGGLLGGNRRSCCSGSVLD
jgi:hypothetical protein